MRKTYLYKLGCTYILYIPLGWGFLQIYFCEALQFTCRFANNPHLYAASQQLEDPGITEWLFVLLWHLGTIEMSQKLVGMQYQMSQSWRLFRNVPDKNGFPYANVLACFGEIRQTAGKEVSNKVWMSPFQRSEQDKHTQRQRRVHVRAERYSLLLPKFFSSFPSNFACS